MDTLVTGTSSTIFVLDHVFFLLACEASRGSPNLEFKENYVDICGVHHLNFFQGTHLTASYPIPAIFPTCLN